ncbi:MAG TPA: undecaprenyl-diphosphate phosphatase [Candidatus Cybelea sp.]|nr:undecaprenyl-diphosphate phosphatase [Candidatus Cybelea sp.]
MPNTDILILSILRGVSEIFPIDLAAHFTLLTRLFCWPALGDLLDAAGDFGLLVALLLYLWRDVLQLLRSLGRAMRGKRDPGARLLLGLVLGSLPAFAITFVLRDRLDVTLRDPVYTVVLLVAFGVVLYVADQAGLTVRRLDQMDPLQAAVIGLFQGLAVLPGISRMGMIVTVARSLGYERAEAARFMLLLSMPWMAASGLYRAGLGIAAGEAVDPDRLLLMAGVSAVAGFLAIAFLMYWLRRGNFTLFAVYRVLLGAALLYALTKLPDLGC